MNVLVAGGNAALQQSIAAAIMQANHRVRRALIEPTRVTPDPFAELAPPVLVGSRAEADAALRACEALVAVDPAVTGMTRARAAASARGLGDIVRAAVAGGGVTRLVLVTCGGSGLADAHDALAQELTRSFRGEWFLIPSAPVYGVGDDPLTRFLILMRSLPAVPIAPDALAAQPLWHEDLARAIAAALDPPPTVRGRVLPLAGPDRATAGDLYDRIARLIGRRPWRLRLPDRLAADGRHGSLRNPASMMPAECAIAGDGLQTDGFKQLGIAATPLERGLHRLIEQLPELTPAQGVGSVDIKTFATHIRQSSYAAADLLRVFRARFGELMPVPVGVEPAAPIATLDEHAMLTLTLPGRGHVAIRVEEVTDDHVIVSTLRGHALAGFVRFSAADVDGGVTFQVMPCDAAANAFDWVALTMGGARIQDANWIALVRNVARLAGGESSQHSDSRRLSSQEAHDVDRWIGRIIGQRTAQALPQPRA